MKRFFAVGLLLTVLNLSAATVDCTYVFSDHTASPQAVKRVVLTPLSWGLYNGTNIALSIPLAKQTDATGSVTVSNLASGYSYRVQLYNAQFVQIGNSFTNSFGTNASGAVYARDYLTISTNLQGGLTAYSRDQSDARFQPLSTNLTGWARIPTNQLSSGGGGTTYTNTGALYAGQISGSGIGTNTSHLAGTNFAAWTTNQFTAQNATNDLKLDAATFNTTIGTRQAATNALKLNITNATAVGLTIRSAATSSNSPSYIYTTSSGMNSGGGVSVNGGIGAWPRAGGSADIGGGQTYDANVDNLYNGGGAVFEGAKSNRNGTVAISGSVTISGAQQISGGVPSTPLANLTTTGTNTAGYFVGDGSQLTGITNGLLSNDGGLITTDGSGNLTATSFTGDGAGLTNLSASSLASGTVALARLPYTPLGVSSNAVGVTGTITNNTTGNASGATNLYGGIIAGSGVTVVTNVGSFTISASGGGGGGGGGLNYRTNFVTDSGGSALFSVEFTTPISGTNYWVQWHVPGVEISQDEFVISGGAAGAITKSATGFEILFDASLSAETEYTIIWNVFENRK